ncbi:Thiamin biosynthesis lipoprotein ApbE [hydrothermal vent metagenome]|uniref:FAD:protein FMN transferase n=1 Tax=hydrothermal vent metagenome TaxID=652676 RepID=A0A1W1DVI8_9ZZZZ
MNRSIVKLYLIAIAFLTLGACGTDGKVQTFFGTTMGTTYTIKVAGTTVATQQKIDERLKQLNKTFSTWDDQSELSLLNKQPINHWISVSDELFYVLKKSKEIHQTTNGYFDPGAGRLIDVWGFGVKKVIQKPSRSMVHTALKNSSIRYIIFRDGRNKAIIKTRDIHINLSAIAKGYAVDELAKLLNTKNHLIEIGGEIHAQGINYNVPWTVGIEHPANTSVTSIILDNQSIATSGNYRNFFIWNGIHYAHILNPITGIPVISDLSSVSVLHSQTMIADAYATAMMAMGSHNAIRLAKRLNLSVILILNKRANFKVIKIN